MDHALLEIRDLTIRYGAFEAVNNLNLQLHGGAVCALIGPNGAGKTSTLRAVAGFQKFQGGTIKIDGLDVSKNPEKISPIIAFMPDHYPLYDDLTAWEYLDHFARAYGVLNRVSVIDESLQTVGLEQKSNSLCRNLSRGMKQRLFIAKTLLHDPKLILLDEPASGLDPKGRIELKKIFLTLRAQNKCLIVSSHILTELQDFCNYFFIMESGKVVKQGSLDSLNASDTGKKFFLRCRLDLKALREIFEASSQGVLVTQHDKGWMIASDSTHPQLANDLLSALIRSSVEIQEWCDLSSNLEHIYLDSKADVIS